MFILQLFSDSRQFYFWQISEKLFESRETECNSTNIMFSVMPKMGNKRKINVYCFVVVLNFHQKQNCTIEPRRALQMHHWDIKFQSQRLHVSRIFSGKYLTLLPTSSHKIYMCSTDAPRMCFIVVSCSRKKKSITKLESIFKWNFLISCFK